MDQATLSMIGTALGTAIGGGIGGIVAGHGCRSAFQRQGSERPADVRRVQPDGAGVEMGGGFQDTEQAYTMSQAAAREMSRSLVNARQYLGKESVLMHS